ncbi:extracellular solute-binding protein [Roseateles asaccharophilus]|uniref:Multiple sugar transport system substrate-binding protein n=1 Tax=Roseateles asaccharophilus TaxID=582607 RepID=A0ABU2A8E5_9BURK|nr:extracellular solute-binding protein [Roseateles asaccharophilus]MDR7333452.1 multiple sugar transport system substrate-binding protein [Roseateles asaccharophilus]
MKRAALLLCAALLAACGPAAKDPAKTEITLMRFFGSCESQFGQVDKASEGVGECGIVTTLVNEFNATHPDIVVRTQIGEWGPYYDQLTARLVSKDIPTVAVMHESALGDYVRRKLVLPLDADFARVGVPVDDFTEHARKGTTFNGQTYALPFDTWAWLWHINTKLMKQAGLLGADGQPVLPRSPEELLAQARQFKQKTGKPFFAWAVANETAANNRTFQTLLAQQGTALFAEDGKSINMQQPAVVNALALMQALYKEGHVRPNLDYAAANQAFLNGQAGVVVVGTWTIDQFLRESQKADSPLQGGYAVRPFAQLYAKPAVFADGHSWALFKGGTTDAKGHEAALTFLKFVWERTAEWSRTGHLPVSKTVAQSEAFRALPQRESLAEITTTGASMPGNVPTQRNIELLIGEDVANLLLSGKPVAEVQASVEKRVNKALSKARR